MWKQIILNKLGISIKDKHKALRIKHRLSLVYAFVGWNCFGILFYVLMKEKTPTDRAERRMSYKHLTGMPDNMHVYQGSGFKLVKEFDVVLNSGEEKGTTEIEKETIKVDKH